MSEHRLLLVLQDIKANGPIDKLEGLCRNLHHHHYRLFDEGVSTAAIMRMLQCFVEWPEGTKSRDYPVPGVNGNGKQMSFSLYDKWSRYGEYGRMRWRLIDWMISQLELVDE